ncbi:MAG: DUF2127 domain-containing protein [Chlorobium sp.]
MGSDLKMTRGLKVVAIFEACKGVLGFAAGLLIFFMLQQNISGFSTELVTRLHLNPTGTFSRILQQSAGYLTESRIHFIAFLLLLYSLMRFVEAYGLWFARRWAEWFALVSGCVYLPFELFELAKGFSWFKIGLVVVNLILVLYMAFVLKHNTKPKILTKQPIRL